MLINPFWKHEKKFQFERKEKKFQWFSKIILFFLKIIEFFFLYVQISIFFRVFKMDLLTYNFLQVIQSRATYKKHSYVEMLLLHFNISPRNRRIWPFNNSIWFRFFFNKVWSSADNVCVLSFMSFLSFASRLTAKKWTNKRLTDNHPLL